MRSVTMLLLLLPVLSIGNPPSSDVRIVSRCPIDNVTVVQSGRFVTSDIDDLLVLQSLGETELAGPRIGGRCRVALGRLVLLRYNASGFSPVWQSSILVTNSGPDIIPTAWTAADLTADDRLEVILVQADSARIFSFTGDTVGRITLPFPSASVEQITGWLADNNTKAILVTVERAGIEPTGYGIAAYRLEQDSWVSAYPLLGLGIDSATSPFLLGAARFADYYEPMPVVALVRSTLRPSSYLALEPLEPGRWRLNGLPFPHQEWFSKTNPLPAGPLRLFNVGDTLVAYGYFVPGARPAGPSGSFAALDDGEWRILRFTPAAQRLAGPACRFRLAGVDGWIEIRDGLIYFYPGEVFH